jgi:hypothetical protein
MMDFVATQEEIVFGMMTCERLLWVTPMQEKLVHDRWR